MRHARTGNIFSLASFVVITTSLCLFGCTASHPLVTQTYRIINLIDSSGTEITPRTFFTATKIVGFEDSTDKLVTFDTKRMTSEVLPIPGPHCFIYPASAHSSDGHGDLVANWDKGKWPTTPTHYTAMLIDIAGHAITLPSGLNGARASGISSKGLIVGGLKVESKYSHACFWRGAGHVLHVLSSVPSFATAANETGVICGQTQAPTGHFKACYWKDSMLHVIPLTSDTDDNARAINSSGEIVGDSITVYYNPFSAWWHRTTEQDSAFMWHGSTATILPGYGINTDTASDVNDQGLIVGSSQDKSDVFHAVMWINSKLIDLNDCCPNNRGWHLDEATSINNNGCILGEGTLNGHDAGFELVPIR